MVTKSKLSTFHFKTCFSKVIHVLRRSQNFELLMEFLINLLRKHTVFLFVKVCVFFNVKIFYYLFKISWLSSRSTINYFPFYNFPNSYFSDGQVPITMVKRKNEYRSTRSLFILCLSKMFTRRENNAGRCRRQRPALFSLPIDTTPSCTKMWGLFTIREPISSFFRAPFSLYLYTTLSTTSSELIKFFFFTLLTFCF